MTARSRRECRLFLFDLDGTLIDSRLDITFSVNRMLARMNMAMLEEMRVNNMIGYGVRNLVEQALRATMGTDPEDPLLERGMELFRGEYGNHLLDHTRLFPHVEEALARLSWADFAVVTNKPEEFSRRILEGLGVAGRFRIILGGDSVAKRKPDPEPLLRAMEFCKAAPWQSVMVGDSAVDIEAGKAARVTTCGIEGFRPKDELLNAGCDFFLGNLLELADLFRPCQPSAISSNGWDGNTSR